VQETTKTQRGIDETGLYFFMLDRGAADKGLKISADRAHQTLLENTIRDYWYDQILVTIPKIKQFFSKSSKEQMKMINSLVDQDVLEFELEGFRERELEQFEDDSEDELDEFSLALEYA
jgi:lipoate-protein ligase A